MNSPSKTNYYPILQLNSGLHGLLLRPDDQHHQGIGYHSTLEKRLTSYRQGILCSLADIQRIADAGIKQLFLEISENRIDSCRDIISMFLQSCNDHGLSLNLVIPAEEKAEMLDLHPFLRYATQNGAELCLGNFGLFGNNFMQVVTTLPKYIFIDQHLLRWCEESKFYTGFVGIIRLLESMQSKVIICGAENTKQLQMIFNAKAELVMSHHLFSPGSIDEILNESSLAKGKSIREKI